jgi:hypothetical protein
MKTMTANSSEPSSSSSLFSVSGRGESNWQNNICFAQLNMQREQPAEEQSWQLSVGAPSTMVGEVIVTAFSGRPRRAMS